MSEINTLSTQLSEFMSTMSGRKGGVNTLGDNPTFPEDMDDVDRDNDIFNFYEELIIPPKFGCKEG